MPDKIADIPWPTATAAAKGACFCIAGLAFVRLRRLGSCNTSSSRDSSRSMALTQLVPRKRKKQAWKLALAEELVPKRAIVGGLSYIEPYDCDWVSVVREKHSGKSIEWVLRRMYGEPAAAHWEKEITEVRSI